MGFPWLWRVGASLHCGVRAAHCRGFLVLNFGLQSHGLQQLWQWGLSLAPVGMWNPPGPGLELVSPHWQADTYHCATREIPYINFFQCYFLCFSSAHFKIHKITAFWNLNYRKTPTLFSLGKALGRQIQSCLHVCVCISIFFILSICISIFRRLLVSLEMLMG